MLFAEPHKSYSGFAEIDWSETIPDENRRALAFLEGEGSILCLRHLSDGGAKPRDRREEASLNLIRTLTAFVQAARKQGYSILGSAAGQVFLRANGDGPALLFDGKTAEILRSYLEGKETNLDDRMKMTLRSF